MLWTPSSASALPRCSPSLPDQNSQAARLECPRPGIRASASGTLIVVSYADATRALQGLVDNAQPHLDPGIQSSLDDQLQAAIASFAAGDTTAGVNQLEAFINHVSAQSGKQI